jgi:hypothetical protein
MRIKILLIVIIVWLTLPFYGQQNILPGVGFQKIKIGMSIENAITILGKPESIRSNKNESTSWKESGYTPKFCMPFLLKFDKVYEFSENNVFGIWKIYVKKGKLVFINLSSYVNNTDNIKKISILDSLFFFDSLDKMISVFGSGYYFNKDQNDNLQYFYLDKGISFIIDEGQVRNAFVYAPIKGKKKTKFENSINKN